MPTPQRAQAVRLAFATTQLERGRRAWRTPDVIGFRRWLAREALRAAERSAPVPHPLRPAEEWLLWREATQEATRGTEWTPSDRLAESLRRAALLMSDWHIAPAVLGAAGTPESALLHRALKHLEARCRATGEAASHELAALLQARTAPRAALFAGFLECTPALRALVESCALYARAPPAQGLGGERAPSGATGVACARDATEELELAAEWCRSRLSADPAGRLLVLIPDLPERRPEALRVLGQSLDPRSIVYGAPAQPSVALEGGAPLAGHPLVRHALTALEFLTGALEFEAFSAWLRAAFWGAPSQADRALLDGWLRDARQIEVSPSGLSAALEAAPGALSSAAKALQSAISAATRALGAAEAAAPAREWSHRFEAALRGLGWPGTRPLSSAEFQTVARFTELLGDFAALGARHLGELAAREARALLEALAARVAYAPGSGDAAVTLSDALVDPVVRYDGIWVAGLTAEAWPAPPSIDPFVPLAAQRSAGIPWSTAPGSLGRARERLRCWRGATPELILSWPAASAEREHLASALLSELPDAQPWRPSEPRERLAQHLRRVRQIEWFEDAAGDPWPAGQPLPGGARALEYQSRCPFRAYAELRLSCAPLGAPRPGIDPRDRGVFLHRALESLWRQLHDSSALEAAQRAGKLGGLIEACVAQAARETWTAPHLVPPPAQSAAAAAYRREEARAVRLLAELATLERQRSAFRVSALELRKRLELAGAVLDLRIDRIDELEDGARIIFDYKSGKPSALDWLADRIGDPQLPAYLLATGEDVVAVAMAHLAAGRVTYRGLSDRPGRLPRVEALQDAWHAQIARWRAVLERLARQFLSGAAAVDPAEGACRFCHLQAFCRIAQVEASRDAAL